MAENCACAFGRYLKTLRERRQLSLDDVCSLAHTFPEKLNKGYLSRCENGRQKLAFAKVIPLSRIYEVPADVLVERMELDLELERVGGPDTDGMTFGELTDAGRKALHQGFRWDAYGYLRDAVPRARVDAVRDSFRDENEQVATACQNLGTAARALGRHRLALHEFLYVDSTGQLSRDRHALLLERIACSFRSLNHMTKARKYSRLAIREAESLEECAFRGHIYFTRARISAALREIDTAIEFYQKSYRVHKDANEPTECALALGNLAQCYFDQRRFKAARRACEAAIKLAVLHTQHRTHALGLILLGDLEDLEGRPIRATRMWKEAVAIAKNLNDRVLRFKAEFALYKRAVQDQNSSSARAIRRRLDKLLPWLPPDTEELIAFRELISLPTDCNTSVS